MRKESSVNDFNVDNIVQITCSNKTNARDAEYGTAFFIGKGILATAKHTLQKYFDHPNDYHVTIKYHDGNNYEMKSVLTKENKYIAIIKLKEKCNDAVPLSFTNGYDIQIGMDCTIYGYPKYAGDEWRCRKYSIALQYLDKSNSDIRRSFRIIRSPDIDREICHRDRPR